MIHHPFFDAVVVLAGNMTGRTEDRPCLWTEGGMQ